MHWTLTADFIGNAICRGMLFMAFLLSSLQDDVSEAETWLLQNLGQDEIPSFLFWIIIHPLSQLSVSFRLCLSLAHILSQQGRWEDDSYCSLKHALWSGIHGNLLLWKPLFLPLSKKEMQSTKTWTDTHKYCNYKTSRVSRNTSCQANVKKSSIAAQRCGLTYS